MTQQDPHTGHPKPGRHHDKDAGGAPDELEEHEGSTETQVGDRTGPAAGYDDEPEQVKDKGGVS